MVEVPVIPTTTVLALGGAAYFFRKPIINAGTMVLDAAVDNPIPTLLVGAVAVPVVVVVVVVAVVAVVVVHYCSNSI